MSIERTKIVVETGVQAPIEKVWGCWTEPEHIMAWNAASDDWRCPRAENDLRVGGTFTFRMEAKDGSFGFDFCGTYTEVIPYEKIAYTIDGDGRKVEVTFTVEGDEVEVVETFEAEDVNPIEKQQDGWQAILDRFADHAEQD